MMSVLTKWEIIKRMKGKKKTNVLRGREREREKLKTNE